MSHRKKKKTRPTPEGPAKAGLSEPVPDIAELTAFPEARGRLYFAIWIAGVCGVALLFLAFKTFSMNAYAGDEHIYLYQAKLISQGVAPYSGFAMAHPPVHAIFTAAVFKLLGYSFLLSRFLPVLWCLAGGLILTVLVKREIGAVASIAAMSLYLLSYEPLRTCSHYTGVNMTVTLLLAAVLAYRMNAIRTSAAFSVLAVFTRLYAAPGILMLVIFALIENRRRGFKLIVWGGAMGIACFVAFGIWSGFGDMIHNMILYQAQKTPMEEESLANMRDKVLFHNFSLTALFGLAQFALAFVLARSRMLQAVRSSRAGLLILADAIAVFFLVVLLNMDRVWMYYFIPSFPFAAIPAGWLVSLWINMIVDAVRKRGTPFGADSSAKKAFCGKAALFAVFVLCFFLNPMLEKRLDYYEKEMAKPEDQRTHTYTWRPGLLPDSVNELMRTLFWKDTRLIGETYTNFNYYLWHESRTLDIVDEAVATIEKETSQTGEIFGDSGTVPLFALLSGRRIAGNEVDTNIQRFRSGNAKPRELLDKIDSPKTEMIILRHGFGITGLAEVQSLVNKKYKAIKSLRTAEGYAFSFFARKQRGV